MINTAISSDLHFGHKNILRFNPKTRSKFRDVEHMDASLIQEWNSMVPGPDDVMYHLGDFAFHKTSEIIKILDQLNGHKVFIRGNHDQQFEDAFYAVKARSSWRMELRDYKEIRYSGTKIILFHFPILVWNQGHHGAIQLHGHCHGSIDHINLHTTRTDVGYDSHGKILTMEEAIAITKAKKYVAVDHHEGM